MSAIDTGTAVGLFELIDPLARGCDQCGAPAGESCREHCTGWPAIVAAVAIDDAVAASEAGRLAIVLAYELRAARIPGHATATTTGGGCVAVALTYPSGNDWMLMAVEVWDGEPTFYLSLYEDGPDATDPVVEVEIHTRISAMRAVVDLAARREVETPATDSPTSTDRTPCGL